MIYNINAYDNMTFSEIYPSFDIFLNGLSDSLGEKVILGFNDIKDITYFDDDETQPVVTIPSLKFVYYALLGKFASQSILSDNVNQFTIQLYTIIRKYGPTWERKSSIQKKLRSLEEKDILKGSRTIRNHATNPDSQPSTDSLQELDFIESQSSDNYERSMIEGYMALWDVLDDDIDTAFLDHFRVLFNPFARPTKTIYFGTKEGSLS